MDETKFKDCWHEFKGDLKNKWGELTAIPYSPSYTKLFAGKCLIHIGREGAG